MIADDRGLNLCRISVYTIYTSTYLVVYTKCINAKRHCFWKKSGAFSWFKKQTYPNSISTIFCLSLYKVQNFIFLFQFLVFVFLVIAIRTCHTFPRPINPDVESPVVDVAKETEYEEHRDADLIESINGGQSGRALLFPYNGVLPLGK